MLNLLFQWWVQSVSAKRNVKSMKNVSNQCFVEQLWVAADMLYKKMETSDYENIALVPNFLKYISDAFEAIYVSFLKGKHAIARKPKTILQQAEVFSER